jgi:hypothetical protein
MKKTSKRTSTGRVAVLRRTIEQLKDRPDTAAVLQAYENLRAMNSLQAIHNQLPTIPSIEVFSTAAVINSH